jgi:hypothetical protein
MEITFLLLSGEAETAMTSPSHLCAVEGEGIKYSRIIRGSSQFLISLIGKWRLAARRGALKPKSVFQEPVRDIGKSNGDGPEDG